MRGESEDGAKPVRWNDHRMRLGGKSTSKEVVCVRETEKVVARGSCLHQRVHERRLVRVVLRVDECALADGELDEVLRACRGSKGDPSRSEREGVGRLREK